MEGKIVKIILKKNKYVCSGGRDKWIIIRAPTKPELEIFEPRNRRGWWWLFPLPQRVGDKPLLWNQKDFVGN
jgi:hypothetical protein